MARIDDLQLKETQLNPTVTQHIVTSLRIQNTSVTAESEISLSLSGFMCRPMIKMFLKCDVTRVFPPLPSVTDRHTFFDPLPLEHDILSGRPSTWWLEWGSNQRPSKTKAPSTPDYDNS